MPLRLKPLQRRKQNSLPLRLKLRLPLLPKRLLRLPQLKKLLNNFFSAQTSALRFA